MTKKNDEELKQQQQQKYQTNKISFRFYFICVSASDIILQKSVLDFRLFTAP